MFKVYLKSHPRLLHLLFFVLLELIQNKLFGHGFCGYHLSQTTANTEASILCLFGNTRSFLVEEFSEIEHTIKSPSSWHFFPVEIINEFGQKDVLKPPATGHYKCPIDRTAWPCQFKMLRRKINMSLNISSLNNSVKIMMSCNLQLITSKISVKWCIWTVQFTMKIYHGWIVTE